MSLLLGGRGVKPFRAIGRQKNVGVTTMTTMTTSSRIMKPSNPKRPAPPSCSRRRNFLTDNSPSISQTRAAGDEPRLWTPLTILGVGFAYSGLLFEYNARTTRYVSEILPHSVRMSNEHTPWYTYRNHRNGRPNLSANLCAQLAFAVYIHSKGNRQQWNRRAKRFPSIGGAIGIGMLGAAAVTSIVYALDKDEKSGNWLGIAPDGFFNSSLHGQIFFSTVDRCSHMLDSKCRQFFQREKWIFCFDTLVTTWALNIFVILNFRHNPIFWSAVWSGLFIGLPLYDHYYGPGGRYKSNITKEANNHQRLLFLPIRDFCCYAVPTVAYYVTGRLAVPIFIQVTTVLFEHALKYPATLPFSIACTPSFRRRDHPLPIPATEDKRKEDEE